MSEAAENEKRTDQQKTTELPSVVRQAVVIVHGMGEQRPLDMLNQFIEAALPGVSKEHPEGGPVYYSRPDEVADSFEARRFLARKLDGPDGAEVYAQTEFYEYHWAHLMQGNRLGDMWTTFRRLMLRPPHLVPYGLRWAWGMFWLLIAVTAIALYRTEVDFGEISVSSVVAAVVGGGATATVLSWLLSSFLPGKISSTFVDVVRYLDTSPRSYEARRSIRQGMVEFLEKLHKKGRYQRIVIVAHSLGAYVAYDGLTYLWNQMNLVPSDSDNPFDDSKLKAVEHEAVDLLASADKDPSRYQELQKALWLEMRSQGCPWLITDFVSVGTPMCMADDLLTKNREEFLAGIERRQCATCPPQRDLPKSTDDDSVRYSYPYKNGVVIYHAAPFAAVRWTNLWFPPVAGLLGDWFGGPLRPLFGNGIKDIPVLGNTPKRYVPAAAHGYYFRFPEDESEESITRELHKAMALDSTSWLGATLASAEQEKNQS